MATSTGLHRFTQIGRAVYAFPSLDSTNAQALKLLSSGRPREGTSITAGYQTDGRGQVGNTWHSPPGLNLCLSVILYPQIAPGQQFLLNLAASLAVRDTVISFVSGDAVTVKWPNDIYIGMQKTAGILIQTGVQGTKMTHAVAGIGLNVNQVVFPDELPNPVSLRMASKNQFWISLEEVCRRVCMALDMRLGQIATPVLKQDYLDALYLKDSIAPFRRPKNGKIEYGAIIDIDQAGRLVIRWANGRAEAFGFREIEFV